MKLTNTAFSHMVKLVSWASWLEYPAYETNQHSLFYMVKLVSWASWSEYPAYKTNQHSLFPYGETYVLGFLCDANYDVVGLVDYGPL